MIGTDEPSATARAHIEALIYGSAVITCDLLMRTLPCAFAKNTHMSKRRHTHILLTLPVMDDEGPFPGIDWPNPGVGELGIDGHDDVQLSRCEPTLAGGSLLS